ncbi:hypothetical protein [Nonomuraea polychroma]|uniref:hypothetical protein n=1 Tax=Nonomuraea polychroma TaxID=46176 RepID=UPI003BA8DB19
MAARLVDEYRLFVYPVVLGARQETVHRRGRRPAAPARGDSAVPIRRRAVALPARVATLLVIARVRA